jgi:hypothetical protein
LVIKPYRFALITRHLEERAASIFRVLSQISRYGKYEVSHILSGQEYVYGSFFLSMALQPFGAWPLFQFQSVRLLGRGISPLQGRYLHTEQQTQNKRTQISMPRVRYEPTTLMFERAKTVHAIDRAATVIGLCMGL